MHAPPSVVVGLDGEDGTPAGHLLAVEVRPAIGRRRLLRLLLRLAGPAGRVVHRALERDGGVEYPLCLDAREHLPSDVDIG